MAFADQYLAKHYKNIVSVSSLPDNDLNISVIIPAYDESGLIPTLESLFNCNKPKSKVEVLILINWPDNAPEKIKQEGNLMFLSLNKWIKKHNNARSITFHPLIYADMPVKYAGVGFARKTLMDEAVRRFNILENPSGIIASLDADTVCEKNYLAELENHFNIHPSADGCVIYFEHPLAGSEFPPSVYHAVCLYELHLRYYVQSIRYTGFRNAFHTVGSAFAVTAAAYCRQGGMNKRKAGEDFYFLQKFFEIGNFTELNSTCVIPSPRPSGRVPFGTGPVIRKFEQGVKDDYLTYNPLLFDILKDFFEKVPDLFPEKTCPNPQYIFNTPECLVEFFEKENFYEDLKEIKANSASPESFMKRFYRWFNMFKILKFLNHGKKWHKDIPVTQAASTLLKKTGLPGSTQNDAFELLQIFREWDRGK